MPQVNRRDGRAVDMTDCIVGLTSAAMAKLANDARALWEGAILPG